MPPKTPFCSRDAFFAGAAAAAANTPSCWAGASFCGGGSGSRKRSGVRRRGGVRRLERSLPTCRRSLHEIASQTINQTWDGATKVTPNRVDVVRDVCVRFCAVRLSENDVDAFEGMTASSTSNLMPMIHLPSRIRKRRNAKGNAVNGATCLSFKKRCFLRATDENNAVATRKRFETALVLCE